MPIQKYGSYEFITKEKMPSGMTTEIIFEAYEHDNGTVYYWVNMNVYHKRKQKDDNTLKQTGKDGIHSLLWGKKQLIEFEKLIKNNQPSWTIGKDIFVIVAWEENKRRRVYERGLNDLGYVYSHSDVHDGKKVLIKQIL